LSAALTEAASLSPENNDVILVLNFEIKKLSVKNVTPSVLLIDTVGGVSQRGAIYLYLYL